MTGRKIAFLGTGLMGAPMARRLLGAGFAVTVWNRDRNKADALVADGATVAATAAEAAKGASVLFTMLTNGGAVSEVLFGSGVTDALAPGAVVIDNSSIAPPMAREHAAKLAERGFRHIDAPVSGGVVGAAAGTLAIMAGGDADVIDSVRDVLARSAASPMSDRAAPASSPSSATSRLSPSPSARSPRPCCWWRLAAVRARLFALPFAAALPKAGFSSCTANA